MSKVKIVLLGTIHFIPSKIDANKNKTLDPTTEENQKELQDLVNKLAEFRPDKIFVELPAIEQKELDEKYSNFLNRSYVLKENEIDQLAFRIGEKLNLRRLNCVNYIGSFDNEKVEKFAQEENQATVVEKNQEYVNAFLSEVEKKQNTLPLIDFFIFLNSPYALTKNLSTYLKFYPKIGTKEKYIGTNLVVDWYQTNLYVYTNILRQLEGKDNNVLVLFGQGHVPILKHLFTNNPDFEVIEVENLLK